MPESLRREVLSQPVLLSNVLETKVEPLPAGSLLVGAGDSYAAALGASYLSSLRCVALDPYELTASPEISRSKTIVFVSVSGRTKSNVAAARRIGRNASETIALTANLGSPLARAVDRTLTLPYEYQVRRPGLASFTLSLLACTRLAVPDFVADFGNAFSNAKKVFRRLRLSRGGTTFFLGNQALYAASIYAAAKLYEFFGSRAQYQRLEEFSHMELFSLKRRDAVNIYEGFDPMKIGSELAKSLREADYDSSFVGSNGLNRSESVFSAVFATQLAVLRWAREMEMAEPHLAGARQKLRISDSMIY